MNTKNARAISSACENGNGIKIGVVPIEISSIKWWWWCYLISTGTTLIFIPFPFSQAVKIDRAFFVFTSNERANKFTNKEIDFTDFSQQKSYNLLISSVLQMSEIKTVALPLGHHVDAQNGLRSRRVNWARGTQRGTGRSLLWGTRHARSPRQVFLTVWLSCGGRRVKPTLCLLIADASRLISVISQTKWRHNRCLLRERMESTS